MFIFRTSRKFYKRGAFIGIIILLTIILVNIAYFQYEVMLALQKSSSANSGIYDETVETQYKLYSNQWQPVDGMSHKMFVYSAYYDDRNNGNMIRIIGLSEPGFSDDIRCKLHFQNNEIEISAYDQPLDNTEADLVAVFVACALPEGLKPPRAVSVNSSSNQKITNMLLVQRIQPWNKLKKNNADTLAVCVTPLNENYSQKIRLIEFIELNTIMGVDHFIFYVKSLSEDFRCLLTDYEKQGRVSVKNWNLPISARENNNDHDAASNDCLYQTMDEYTYTTFLSIDEFLVPKKASSLKDLLRFNEGKRDSKNTAAYLFKVANFYLELPDVNWNGINYNTGVYLMTISKTYRKIDSSRATKAICKPTAVLQVLRKRELQLVSGFHSSPIREQYGLCHRYRLAPAGQSSHPDEAIQDLSARKFTPQLLQAFSKQYQTSMPHCSLPSDWGIILKPADVLLQKPDVPLQNVTLMNTL